MKINPRRFPRACLFAGLLLTVIGSVAPAQEAAPTLAATTITKVPFTISKPGTYLLKKDLIFGQTTGDAIMVAAFDVIIDLGGRTLSCNTGLSDTHTTVGIHNATTANLIVRNGNIRGFQKGIDSTGANNTTGVMIVEDLTVTGCGFFGINAKGRFVDVHRCRVTDTGSVTSSAATDIDAILVDAGSYRVVDNSVADTIPGSGQYSAGIKLLNLQGGLIARNCVTNAILSTQSNGIFVAVGYAFVNDNGVTNSDVGIGFSTGPDAYLSKYRDNSTVGCNTPFFRGTAVGSNNN